MLSDTVEVALKRAARITLFASPARQRRFVLPQESRLSIYERPAEDSNPVLRTLWYLSGLASEVRSAGATHLLCLSGGGVAPAGVVAGTLIQQSLPFSKEALGTLGAFGRVRMQVLRTMMARSCRAADVVFVQTPTMSNWVSQAFQLDPSRVHVVTPNVPTLTRGPGQHSPVLSTMRQAPKGGRLLYVGNDEPYKNLRALLDGFSRLVQRRPDARLFLTLPPDHPLASAPHVSGIGYLDQSALAEAYDLADALVMPSLVETVGLPLAEAMQIGVVAIAADRPYAHDICGTAAAYFDPRDPRHLAWTLERVLSDPTLMTQMRQAGHRISSERAASHPYVQMIESLSGTNAHIS